MIKPFKIIITLDVRNNKEEPNGAECVTYMRTEGLAELYDTICHEVVLATAIKSNVRRLMPFIFSNAEDIAGLLIPLSDDEMEGLDEEDDEDD